MNRIRAVLILAFLPGAALLLACVWTMTPSDWFTALYGNPTSAVTGHIVAQVVTPCPTPRTAPTTPAVHPVVVPPRQQNKAAIARDIPRHSPASRVARQPSDEPYGPVFNSPWLIDGGYGTGHRASRQPRSLAATRAMYQQMWARQSESNTFFIQLSGTGDGRVERGCAGHHADRQEDEDGTRPVFFARRPSPFNAGQVRVFDGWSQAGYGHRTIPHVNI